MYKRFIRPILFSFNPEAVHHFSTGAVLIAHKLGLGGLLKNTYCINDERLERKVFGLTFKNPIGLAAGFDKNASLYNAFSSFGFGFIEVGTVTPKGQLGNPKPRMFRLPQDSGLINRMGFNNEGMAAAIRNLKQRKTDVVIGGNIGKNKVTPNDEAIEDYRLCFEGLYPYVDYFVVNVSSPNTPNLRDLQDKEPLKALLTAVQSMNNATAKRKPLLLKIAPDLTDGQLDDIVAIAQETHLDGLIATNTTINRSGLKTAEHVRSEAGGLSGKPVSVRSTEVIRYLAKALGPEFPIIGVGGVFTAEDALEKLDAGAHLVQVYTGFIYEGPGMVKRILKGILKNRS